MDNKTRTAQFNARLWTASKESGLKLTDIPEAMGLSRSGWYAKRNGKTEFTLKEAERLAMLLGVSITWLFPWLR